MSVLCNKLGNLQQVRLKYFKQFFQVNPEVMRFCIIIYQYANMLLYLSFLGENAPLNRKKTPKSPNFKMKNNQARNL